MVNPVNLGHMRIAYMSEGGEECSPPIVIQSRRLFFTPDFVECLPRVRNCVRCPINLQMC